MSPVAITAIAVDLVICAIGLVLLWRHVLSPRARTERPSSVLLFWDIPLSQFFAILWYILLGMLIFAFTATVILRPLESLDATTKGVIASGAAQLGMIAGILISARLRPETATPAADPALRAHSPLLAGLAVFSIILPVVAGVSLLWQNGLEAATGVEPEPQELVDIFANADHPAEMALLLLIAVVGAPITEELIFRAGIFRYMRQRTPRALALLVPSLLFGLLHFNIASFIPLVAFGVVLSLAYERTGDIRVCIIAHGLFNLNSVAMILAGVDSI